MTDAFITSSLYRLRNHTTMNTREETTMDEYVSHCPACGEPIDYCQGHGEIGDPSGYAILVMHDDDDHSMCDPNALCGDQTVIRFK